MRWFVLRVKNRKAIDIAKKIGLEHCWLPVESRWTKPARKHKPVKVEVNLIPGWLFVQEDQLGLWSELDGVHGVLKYGKQGTLWIEDFELDGLRSACDTVPEEPQRQPDAPKWVPGVGSRVKLKGLFYGRLGVVYECLKDDMYHIQVEGMKLKLHKKLLSRAPEPD